MYFPLENSRKKALTTVNGFGSIVEPPLFWVAAKSTLKTINTALLKQTQEFEKSLDKRAA